MIKTQGFDSNSLLEARFHILNEKEIHRWLFNHRAEERGRDKIADTYFRNTYLPSLNDLQHSSPCIDSFYRANIQKPFFRNKGVGDLMNPRKLYRLAGNKTKQLSINVTKSDNRGRFIIGNVRLPLPHNGREDNLRGRLLSLFCYIYHEGEIVK